MASRMSAKRSLRLFFCEDPTDLHIIEGPLAEKLNFYGLARHPEILVSNTVGFSPERTQNLSPCCYKVPRDSAALLQL
jgi:hypothetical protein